MQILWCWQIITPFFSKMYYVPKATCAMKSISAFTIKFYGDIKKIYMYILRATFQIILPQKP